MDKEKSTTSLCNWLKIGIKRRRPTRGVCALPSHSHTSHTPNHLSSMPAVVYRDMMLCMSSTLHVYKRHVCAWKYRQKRSHTHRRRFGCVSDLPSARAQREPECVCVWMCVCVCRAYLVVTHACISYVRSWGLISLCLSLSISLGPCLVYRWFLHFRGSWACCWMTSIIPILTLWIAHCKDRTHTHCARQYRTHTHTHTHTRTYTHTQIHIRRDRKRERETERER